MAMKRSFFVKVFQYSASSVALLAALGSSGCMQEASSSPYKGNIIAEANIDQTTRLVFVDEGEGNVGVAELSRMGDASILMAMFQREHASPLEIFLAAAEKDAAVPEILVANHRDIAVQQGREDLTPRRVTLRQDEPGVPASTLATDWHSEGTTACTAAGWEGPTGVWGNPVDAWWAVIFTNSTKVYTNNVTYPATQTTKQLVAWNGGSGAFHSHGACLGDNSVDQPITFTVRLSNSAAPVFEFDLDEVGGDFNYVIYNDYISVNNRSMISKITNAGNPAASFRHSAAAWVPLPQ
jgi:hypothetical protein